MLILNFREKVEVIFKLFLNPRVQFFISTKKIWTLVHNCRFYKEDISRVCNLFWSTDCSLNVSIAEWNRVNICQLYALNMCFKLKRKNTNINFIFKDSLLHI